jgi:3-dehydroquinate synthase II
MALNEGILVGSSSATMVLIHSETIPSMFVPIRPFRVNAGSPHAYILMANQSTKYLSELKTGDQVLAVNFNGTTRPIVLGKIKIEPRPMLKVSLVHTGMENETNVFIQQAETERLVGKNGECKSVTDLGVDDVVIGRCGYCAWHLGNVISIHVEER